MEFPMRGRPIHNPIVNENTYNPNVAYVKPKEVNVVFGKSPDRFFEDEKNLKRKNPQGPSSYKPSHNLV